MRTKSVYAATCHRCGAELQSEAPAIKCRCGILVCLEWPASKDSVIQEQPK